MIVTTGSSHLVLTGASSGLGRALAIRLAALGYRLSMCGFSEKKLKHTQSLLPSNTQQFVQAFDLANQAHCQAFYDAATDTFGPVDVLINCAGLNNSRNAADAPAWDALENMMSINFKAPVLLMSLVLPQMKKNKNGCIINVLSTVCLFSNPGISAYTASKSALDSYSKVLRKELTGTDVRLMSVYPGGMNTDFRATERPDYLSADEVADAIVLLLQSKASSHIHELVLRPAVEVNYV